MSAKKSQTASRRLRARPQPKTLDRLQYGAGFAIAFGLFGTLLGIALARFLRAV